MRGAELKQELQVRQKTIHDTPDNEKTAEKSMDENEKSDPTKSPEAPFGSNKMPSSTPLKSMALLSQPTPPPAPASSHQPLRFWSPPLRP